MMLLACANDPNNPLEQLMEEEKVISRHFTDLVKENRYRLSQISNATTDRLADEFLRFGNEIQIFHFAGHANSEAIQLFQGEANKQGISSLINITGKVILVFLNGCSTLGHVHELLENGTKVVIATHTKIGDETATFFADRFYKALAEGKSIRDSFEWAKSQVILANTFGQDRFITNEVEPGDRAIGDELGYIEERDQKEVWDIFYYKENSDYVDWKLPVLMPNKKEISASVKNLYRDFLKATENRVQEDLETRNATTNRISLNYSRNDEGVYSFKDIYQHVINREKIIITGEPGAGKTITSLLIAKRQIERAHIYSNEYIPIPVRLNLSTWSVEKQPLEKWMAAQMDNPELGLEISKSEAAKLLKDGLIFPILDGLDQVPTKHQKSCIKSIRNFVGNKKRIPLLLGSRHQTYLKNKTQLPWLKQKIRILPLSENQIKSYLVKVNKNTENISENQWDEKIVGKILQYENIKKILCIPYYLKITKHSQETFPFERLKSATSESEVVEILLDQRIEGLIKLGNIETIQYEKRSISAKIYRFLKKKIGPNKISKKKEVKLGPDELLENRKVWNFLYGKYNEKSFLAWLYWLADKIKENEAASETFSVNSIQPCWLPKNNYLQIIAYYYISRIIQVILILLCLKVSLIAIPWVELPMLIFLIASIVTIVDLLRLKIKGPGKWAADALKPKFEKTHQEIVKSLLKATNILALFILSSIPLMFFLGGNREAPEEELVVLFGQTLSNNGINLGILISLVVSGVFGFRGSMQSFQKDTLPKSNSDFEVRSAISGAISYAILFAVVIPLIAFTTFTFSNEITDYWLEIFSNLHLGPLYNILGVKTTLQKYLVLGIFFGLIYGAIFGAILQGRKGKVQFQTNKEGPVKKDSDQKRKENLKTVFKSFLSYLIIYTTFFLSFTLYLHDNVPFSVIFIKSFLLGFTFASVTIVWYGGFDTIQNWVLKIFLLQQGTIPSFRYQPFLDQLARSGFLESKEEGYMFEHDVFRDRLAKRGELENSSSHFSSKWGNALRNYAVIACVILGLWMWGNSNSETLTWNYFYPGYKQNQDQNQFFAKVGDNIPSADGVLLKDIHLSAGDTLLMKGKGLVNVGDFITWMPPKGSFIAMLGFPVYGAYNLENLENEVDTPLSAVVWRTSGDNCWHMAFDKPIHVIEKPGTLALNVNGIHYQKIKGHFYLQIKVKRKYIPEKLGSKDLKIEETN